MTKQPLTIEKARAVDAMHRLGQIWGVTVSPDRNGVVDAVVYGQPSNFRRIVAYANFMFRVMHRRNQYPDLRTRASSLVSSIGASGRNHVPLLLVVEWRGGLFYWRHSTAGAIRLEYDPVMFHNATGREEQTMALVPTMYFRRVTSNRNPFVGAGAGRNRDKVTA